MTRYQWHAVLVAALVIISVVVIFLRPIVKGLDIDGGIRVLMQVNPNVDRPEEWTGLNDTDKSTKLEAIKTTVTNRVKGLAGVAEPKVNKLGTDRVSVELPGVKDAEGALNRIRSTASLEFYYLRDVQNRNNPTGQWRMDPPRQEGDPYIFTGPRGETIDSNKQPKEVLEKVVNTKANPPVITGGDLLSDAKSTFSSGNKVVVTISFTRDGTRKFADFTRQHVDDYLAVFYDGKLLTAPSINEAIPGGHAEVSGFKNLEEARGVAEQLNSGALPVPLKVISYDSVEPTLGKETVNKVLLAGILGLVLVILFMAFYYRLPGVLADISLGLYTLFVIAIFKLFGVTVSLPGLAALIISIGMAVDANILIFERVKEELRDGKTLRAAIDAGFSRAFTAIFDSNMCTAITCAILMWYGSPAVQSFALTLLVGVGISMFTAITVTRTFLHLLVEWQWAQKPSLYGLTANWVNAQNKQWDIVGKRKWWFILSAILIIPGLIVLATSGLKPGIEFTSGTAVQVSFEKPVTLEEVRSAAAEFSPGMAPEVQLSKVDGQEKVAFIRMAQLAEGKEKELREALDKKFGIATRAIRVSFTKAVDEEAVQELAAKHSKTISASVSDPVSQGGEGKNVLFLMKYVPDTTWTALREELAKSNPIVGADAAPTKSLDSVSTVDATISKELTRNAFWSVLIACVGIVLYLTSRFAIGGFAVGLKYGVCAVIALVHDSAFILGLFAILGKVLGWEIDSLFVTAVLTIIGFSVHDTIVVFDRIRENLRHRLRGESFEQLANRSVLQTLSRSINTSLVVVLTLLALTLFGGPLLRHFYVALLVGIIVGTYSSIFNATPLVIVWEQLANKTKEPKRKAFEDKPLVEKPLFQKPDQIPTTPADLESGEPAETIEPAGEAAATDAAKAARAKRKTTKKRRF